MSRHMRPTERTIEPKVILKHTLHGNYSSNGFEASKLLSKRFPTASCTWMCLLLFKTNLKGRTYRSGCIFSALRYFAKFGECVEIEAVSDIAALVVTICENFPIYYILLCCFRSHTSDHIIPKLTKLLRSHLTHRSRAERFGGTSTMRQ